MLWQIFDFIQKFLPDIERAACRIWSRIAFVSIIILFIRFFLPRAILTIVNVTYNSGRVIFKSVGIYVVLKHEKELRDYLDPVEATNAVNIPTTIYPM
jgi:hypothetical protein